MLDAVTYLQTSLGNSKMDFSSPAVIMLAIFLACLFALMVGIGIFIFCDFKDDPE